MKQIYTLLFTFFSAIAFAQISGKITDVNGQSLPAVSIFIEGSLQGTSSNEDGLYELTPQKAGNYTIVFQYLGYQTQRIKKEVNSSPINLPVVLLEENLQIQEITIDLKENPANEIIRKAIANRGENGDRIKRYTADFYSKGMFKLKDMPKKFLGVDVGDMGGSLDSLRSGIIYLSETISKIKFEKPNHLSENVIASKVSGNNNGFSYNTAIGANFDFYANTLNFGVKLISPIANNAFQYYSYKLEGTFVDDHKHTINKIKVIAKRDLEPVFDGYIYIIDDSWQIYAVDLQTKGYRAKNEMLEKFSVQQNYAFNDKENAWAKNTQFITLDAGIFGIKFNGKYSHVFSNYDFVESFQDKTFTKEIVKIEKEANKKDADYWNQFRGIPLTQEENLDYIKKDSIYQVRNSDVYLDSIDKKNNRFKLFDIVKGYTYKKSVQKSSFNYKGLLNFSSINFNTVQGWNYGTGFSYSKIHNDFGKTSVYNLDLNYGFADERLRYVAKALRRFNTQNYQTIQVKAGVVAEQFNSQIPISKFVNSLSSLLFANNFMKLYNKEFVDISYSQLIHNSLQVSGILSLEQRKALFENTDFKWVKTDDTYFSNNPLSPEDFTSKPFMDHKLAKFDLKAKIYFGTKYISRPDAKIVSRNPKFPFISIDATTGFAGTSKDFEYQKIQLGLLYNLDLANFGNLSMNAKAGKFFNADKISFVDFQHFNGNQTHVGTGENYLNVFNMMPYYSNSTNRSYGEFHAEYNDNGYFINKLPLLNLLRGKLVLGMHHLATADKKPYQEFTAGLDGIGFGKFKIFRIDYIRSYQNGYVGDGVIFGAKFLNVLN